MRHLETPLTLFMILTSFICSRTFAQDIFDIRSVMKFNNDMMIKTVLEKQVKQELANEVMQDNEYNSTGYEDGIYLSNPLMLNGKPLDYGEFNLASTGQLTVHKGTTIAGETTPVPFYAYLRRNGIKLPIPGKERPDTYQTGIDLSEILRYAAPGDHLVIEAVNKKDGAVKRILKLLNVGC